ncbi:MAG TPA: glycosyltransferase family 39 protein [Bryobacteraceae bacterium]|nr:glycosyltransferase family 39 protein [Bryobacteraceae bacterium]
MACCFFLYLFRLSGTGLLGPDEPRYAAIGRQMAWSSDWITPRLWGRPWFEKPALLYWMTAAGFRLGLGEETAPRAPVALLSLAFLAFFAWAVRRVFDGQTAGYATAILGACAGWVSFSYIPSPDLPMTAFFSAAMLAGMIWRGGGSSGWLTGAAALLGFSVLAKGLVPLALALPFGWYARARWKDLFGWRPWAAFLFVTVPWYWLCYAKNGSEFVRIFFWEHHVQRFLTPALLHPQPGWFYLPVLAAALFPWTPVLALFFSRRVWRDDRCRFLLLWLGFGLLFFSKATNKLPGYILPLVPAAAVIGGVALARARGAARWILAASAALMCLVFPLASMLPQALAAGLSRASIPAWSAAWTAPLLVAAAVWYLDTRSMRSAAALVITAAAAAAVVYLKTVSFPQIDAMYSTRPLWRQIAASQAEVCLDGIQRSWRYGLNYYSVEPLPDCDQVTRPARIRQFDGPPVLCGTGGIVCPP